MNLKNSNISFKTVLNLKTNDTLLSPTFKVEESKVPLFFGFWTVLNEIWPFWFSKVHPQCWWRAGYKCHLEAFLKYRLCFFWLLKNIGEWPKKLKKKSRNHRALGGGILMFPLAEKLLGAFDHYSIAEKLTWSHLVKMG